MLQTILGEIFMITEVFIDNSSIDYLKDIDRDLYKMELETQKQNKLLEESNFLKAVEIAVNTHFVTNDIYEVLEIMIMNYISKYGDKYERPENR